MKYKILGVTIDDYTHEECISEMKNLFMSGKQHFIATPNPEFVVLAQKNKEFFSILKFSSMSLPDGVGMLFANIFLHHKVIHRITGNDAIKIIAGIAEQKRYSIYLLGGDRGVPQKASEVLKQKFHNIRIAGTHDGLIQDVKNIEMEVVENIQKAAPDILFVALGHGKQEGFIFHNLSKFPTVKIAIGVGGALDYLSGVKKRAPKFMQRLGLEWVYRLILEPRRWKRIIDAVIIFPYLIIKGRINQY